MTEAPEVAIIGAGPYALSLAAHLRALDVEHRIFGSTMHTWRTQMPRGMFLKSDGFASNLYDREQSFTLQRYSAETGVAYADEGVPVSLDTFCAYGLAFQKRFAPQVEPKLVTRLKADGSGIELQLDDGEKLRPRKVVLAVGISHFQHVPEALASLPPEFCSHSSACVDPARFKGRDVTIIGRGASALDLAGLLHAAGALVRLVTRKPSLAFHAGPASKPRSLWQRMRRPKSGLGPSLRSLLYSEAPMVFHHLPERTRLRIARNYLGPSGGWFMRDQVLGKVPVMLGSVVEDVWVRQDRVHLRLHDGDGKVSEISTDHIIAATGYRTDLRRLPFLDDELLPHLRMIQHAPVLSAQFETSTPGLHVIGPAATNSFGPVMRFAFGARFTAQRLSTHLAPTRLRSSARVTPANSRAQNNFSG